MDSLIFPSVNEQIIEQTWFFSLRIFAQSDGAAEYTNCISAEGEDSPKECSRYVTKQSDVEAPVMLEIWGIRSTHLLQSFPGPL